MRSFLDNDYLLTTDTAKHLYHEVAAHQPIFDYHCHLDPREIAENKRFANLADIWLGGDHYKWRVMRANGVDERFITGDGAPYDKYIEWAKTMPFTLGNPLYPWTHMELQRYFDIYDVLDESSAKKIWDAANAKLATDDMAVHSIFKKFKVAAVGTTDDPADSLEWHKKIKADGKTATKVLPSFRPDKAILLEVDGFSAYIEKLGKAANIKITTLADLLSALSSRVAFFDEMGCRASDHGIEYVPFTEAAVAPGAETAADKVFKLVLSGGKPNAAEIELYKTIVLAHLGKEYAAHGWAMQLHLASLRSNNSRMFKKLGPNTGYDATHDPALATKLSGFLDLLESRGQLPKTILYSLNPKDHYTLATIMGCFQGGGIPGKMQLGAPWWFLDHKDGMEDQMKILGNVGLLPRFIGMLTDSRSFLSYPRHEYFRRILCAMLGRWAEAGEIPASAKLLDKVVADISFGNAERYFAK
ncbi:MAG: glucuronate isomerase [Treponemataceae bacterium]